MSSAAAATTKTLVTLAPITSRAIATIATTTVSAAIAGFSAVPTPTAMATTTNRIR